MSDEEATLDTGNSAEQDAQEDWEQRAKDHQAGFTKSQQELAAERAIWDDEEKLVAKLAEKGFTFAGNDEEEDLEDEYVEDEDDAPLTVGQWKAHLREQEAAAQRQSNVERFESDFKAAINGRDLDQWGERAIRYAAFQGEIKDADDLKKQVDEYLERQQPAKTRPRAPHVPTTGSAATEVPDWDNMTRGEINRYMVERVRAEEAQT